MKELLQRYSRLNDELLNYTEEHYDDCLYDIEGYWVECGDYIVEEEDDIVATALKGRVNAMEKLVEAYKLLESNQTIFA